jgi:hypothetical protein
LPFWILTKLTKWSNFLRFLSQTCYFAITALLKTEHWVFSLYTTSDPKVGLCFKQQIIRIRNMNNAVWQVPVRSFSIIFKKRNTRECKEGF